MSIKILTVIISLFFTNSHCCETKQNQDNTSFEYTAVSRGSYKKIIVNHSTISVITKRDSQPKIKNCNEDIWNRLNDILNNVNLDELSTLQSTSENRFADRAAIANLSVNYKGKTYKTQGFDDGNPPKEIALLVKEILSIAQNID